MHSNTYKRRNKFSSIHSIKGDDFLLWDKAHEAPSKHCNFDSLWLGPYTMYEILGTNDFKLKTLDGEPLQFLVNGHHLKLFYARETSSLCTHVTTILFLGFIYLLSFQF
jgi:hypothetical protein